MVFGMTSHSERSPGAVFGTRRMATVTMSQPERRKQSAVSSRSLYLPVPVMSRDDKATLPNTNEESAAAISASTDEGHDFDDVAVFELGLFAQGAAHHLAVVLDGHLLEGQGAIEQQLVEVLAGVDDDGVSVDGDAHGGGLAQPASGFSGLTAVARRRRAQALEGPRRGGDVDVACAMRSSLALLSLALAPAVVAACGPKEPEPIDYADTPLAGTIDGAAWTMAVAHSDSFLDDEDGFFAVFLETAPAETCSPGGDGRQVLARVPLEVGEQRLTLSHNATFSYVDDNDVTQNDVAIRGGIRVDEVDEDAGVVKGALNASTSDHEVNGTFEMTICVE